MLGVALLLVAAYLPPQINRQILGFHFFFQGKPYEMLGCNGGLPSVRKRFQATVYCICMFLTGSQGGEVRVKWRKLFAVYFLRFFVTCLHCFCSSGRFPVHAWQGLRGRDRLSLQGKDGRPLVRMEVTADFFLCVSQDLFWSHKGFFKSKTIQQLSEICVF